MKPLSALDAPTRESLRRHLRQVLTQLKRPRSSSRTMRSRPSQLADDAVILSAGACCKRNGAGGFLAAVDPSVAHNRGHRDVSGDRRTHRRRSGDRESGNGRASRGRHRRRLSPVYVCIREKNVTLEHGHADKPAPAIDCRASPLGGARRPTRPRRPRLRVPLTALVTRPASAQLDLARRSNPNRPVQGALNSPGRTVIG